MQSSNTKRVEAAQILAGSNRHVCSSGQKKATNKEENGVVPAPEIRSRVVLASEQEPELVNERRDVP